MTKTRLALTAAGAIILATLTGCAATPTAAPQVDSTPVVTTTHTNAERAYLETVHSMLPETADVDDATTLEVATSACDAFGSGASYTSIVDVMTPALTIRQASVMVGAATGTICPEYADEINAQ